jgi:hypothetical protein
MMFHDHENFSYDRVDSFSYDHVKCKSVPDFATELDTMTAGGGSCVFKSDHTSSTPQQVGDFRHSSHPSQGWDDQSEPISSSDTGDSSSQVSVPQVKSEKFESFGDVFVFFKYMWIVIECLIRFFDTHSFEEIMFMTMRSLGYLLPFLLEIVAMVSILIANLIWRFHAYWYQIPSNGLSLETAPTFLGQFLALFIFYYLLMVLLAVILSELTQFHLAMVSKCVKYIDRMVIEVFRLICCRLNIS